MIRFLCVHCGHKLKAQASQAGKNSTCPQCGQSVTVPLHSTAPARLSLGLRLAALGLLVIAAVVGVRFFLLPGEVEQKLTDLRGAAPELRAQALVWLAQADPQDASRARVMAVLEPLLFEGDAHKDLDANLVLRAYLHWAGPDNVPTLIRLVENPTLPSWSVTKTGWVMEALGKLQDASAAPALAAKLPDPELHDQAVNALKLLGPSAEDVVLNFVFVEDPATRFRATQLLMSYQTRPERIAAEAVHRLQSNDPEIRLGAAAWYAENSPDDETQKAHVAPLLARLLDDLSPRVDAVALQALKLWATPDCLPQLADFAQRQARAGLDSRAAVNNAALLDVLSRFPDKTAASAIALQLVNPAQRTRAVQALLKFGPVAEEAVLPYLNYPDDEVQKDARDLCRLLHVSTARQLKQTLADVVDTQKARSRAALQYLAQLRPDEADRAAVSAALTAPLLDPDWAVREDALDAARIWGSKENVAALAKTLADFPTGEPGRDVRILAKTSAALIAIGPAAEEAVIPLLQSPQPAVRWEACRVLTEVGTSKSVAPLQQAAQLYGGPLYNLVQLAVVKIQERG